LPSEVIENKIYLIRGQKVMLNADLAKLYAVETKYLNRQVRRNIKRFPVDFMFRLTKQEAENLRCQFGTSSQEETTVLRSQVVTSSWGGHRYLPLAFTEQGIAMLSTVLNSKRAIFVNIAIMRAFVKLRQVLATHKELAHKLEQLEQKVGQNSSDIRLIFAAIRKLMEPPPLPPAKPKRIGFIVDQDH